MPQLLDKKGLTEEEFLRQYDPDKYPKPSLTADIVVFRERGGAPEVLLVRRGGHPFLGRWAFPGGFAERNERIERTAERELMEETARAKARAQNKRARGSNVSREAARGAVRASRSSAAPSRDRARISTPLQQKVRRGPPEP